MLEYTPVFIHIPCSGGRSLRRIFEKTISNNIYIHHINPGLWNKDVPKDRIIRLWIYRDVKKMLKTDKITRIIPPVPITELKLINNKSLKYFVILRNPVYRVLSEIKYHINNIITDSRGWNIICKSILIAFTNNLDIYFTPINNNDLDLVKKYIIKNNVMIGFTNNFNNILTKLSSHLETDIFLDYINKKNNINSNSKYDNNNIELIKRNNKYDILLYDWAIKKEYTFNQ